MTTVGERAGAAWAAFGQWQRRRPFWGGLFLLLAAVELFVSANMDLLALTVHLGPTGFLSYVIPLMLALCGALVWASPGQRTFYGIVGLAVAVYSLIGLNLGGFIVGLVLGVVGGALSVAWAPFATRPIRPVTPTDDTGDDGDDDGPEIPPGGWRHRRPRRRNMFVHLWLVIAVLTTPVAAQHRAAAATPGPGSGEGTVTSPAAPTSSAPTSPVPTTSAPVGTSPSSTGATPTTATSSAPPAPGSAASAPGPQAAQAVQRARLLPVDPGQPWVNEVPSEMIAGTLTMAGLSYDGVVDLPTARGTIRALLFSMENSVATPFELRVPTVGGGHTSIRSRSLTVDGSVKFYTTRFRANLFGVIPVTFTPGSPPLLTVPKTFFTNADIDLVYVRSDTLIAPAMTITSVA